MSGGTCKFDGSEIVCLSLSRERRLGGLRGRAVAGGLGGGFCGWERGVVMGLGRGRVGGLGGGAGGGGVGGGDEVMKFVVGFPF